MIEAIKDRWHSLKSGKPGKRFQDEYDKRHGEKKGHNLFMLIGGIIVLAAGIFFLPAPGPGFLIVALGGGMIAQESKHAAKVLDRIELFLRHVLEWALGIWKKSPLAVKVLIVIVALAVVAAAVYLAYRILFR